MPSHRSTSYNYSGSLLATLGLLFFTLYFLFLIFNLGDAGAGKLLSNPASWVVIFGSLVIVPVWATLYFKRKDDTETQDYINRSILRYVVAFLMFYYGYSKIYQKFFDISYITLDSRVADVNSFNLTWYYFGKSNVQEFIIGLMELVPGLLLLFRKRVFIALILLFPICANVMMVNIFNRVSGLTFPISIFLTLAVTYLLYGYKNKIKEFIASQAEPNITIKSRGLGIAKNMLKFIVLGSILYISGITVYNKITKSNKPNLAHQNKFTGAFALTTLKVNGTIIHPDTGDRHYYKCIYLEGQSRWNKILDFSANYDPHAIKIKWNPNNDSVYSWLKTNNDVAFDDVDSATCFSGIYHLDNTILHISGMQYGDTIDAVYDKKPIKEYKWFW